MPALTAKLPNLLPLTAGMAVAILVAATATMVARLGAVSHAGIGALTLAILLGMVTATLMPQALKTRAAAGTGFAQRSLLRAGVALYGLRLTFHDVAACGPAGIAVDLLMVSSTLLLAWWIGTRGFGLDRDTAVLVGAGSAICGAAAVMATEPVLRAAPHKVAVAIATVTIFGSAAIFLYPAMFPLLGFDAHQYGVYAGSTIHEVAQVIAAGQAVDTAAMDQAVIIKLLRVMLLAPFLIVLTRLVRDRTTDAVRSTPLVPGFVLLFVLMMAANSLLPLPDPLRDGLIAVDNGLLAVAMAALGLSTRFSMLRQAGWRPLLLGACLFGHLVTVGYMLNRLLGAWLV